MNGKNELGSKISQLVDELSPFPTDIDELLRAAVKPVEDETRILRLIENNPKVWADISRLTGSYYGVDKAAETPEDALRHIGFQPLVQLIGVAYAKTAIEEEFASLKYLNEYFNHSQEISIGCHILVEVLKLHEHECQMYTTAGLIHDIGRLAILAAGNKTNTHVLGTLWDKMVSVVYDEKTNMGTNHCDVGMRICRKWTFSPTIQEAILRHHTPLINGDFSFPGGIVFIAHFLSASDPSGEIISTVSASEILFNLKLTVDNFDKAREMYKLRTNKNNK